MTVTATEFKKNIGKYLDMATREDVFITKNGKSVAKLTNPKQDRREVAQSLFGILPASTATDNAREERLNRYERLD